MTRHIVILAALAIPVFLAGCPHDHDGGHGHSHDGDSGHDHAKSKKSGKPGSKAPAPKIVTSVKDAICGKAVTTASTHVVERDGTRHYFCSAACQEKFQAGAVPKGTKKTVAGGDHGHDHGDHDHDH